MYQARLSTLLYTHRKSMLNAEATIQFKSCTNELHTLMRPIISACLPFIIILFQAIHSAEDVKNSIKLNFGQICWLHMGLNGVPWSSLHNVCKVSLLRIFRSHRLSILRTQQKNQFITMDNRVPLLLLNSIEGNSILTSTERRKIVNFRTNFWFRKHSIYCLPCRVSLHVNRNRTTSMLSLVWNLSKILSR